MKKIMVLCFLVMLVLPVLMLAQDDPYGDFPFELNEAIVAGFQTIFGLGLLGITQLAKQALKKLIKNWADLPALARHAIMYAVTAIISAGVTYFVLSKMGMMDTGRFILYGVYAWGVCNGFWKALKELIKKHS